MADQKINELPVKTAPTTGDKMLMIGAAEEYQIDYDQLATAILNKLTSKTYTLDQGTKTLVAALNELNSKTGFTVYTSLGSIGLKTGCSITDVYEAMPSWSELFINIYDVSDAPIPYGILHVLKLGSTRSAIFAYHKTGNTDYRMFLDDDGNPTNVWYKIDYTQNQST